MTVQELIDTSNKFEDKQKQVKFLIFHKIDEKGCSFQYTKKIFDKAVAFEDPENVWIKSDWSGMVI